MVRRPHVTVGDVECDLYESAPSSSAVAVCAAHPADTFDWAACDLMAAATGCHAVCVNPRASDGSEAARMPALEEMVDRIEASRRHLGLGPWIFWGMSGGGWLAEIYANRYPQSLAGIVVESACLCFRERLADPACVLSPRFPAWHDGLAAEGLLPDITAAEPQPGDAFEWTDVDGVGAVFRRQEGPALLVSPGPLSAEMRGVMPRLWAFDARPWIRSVRVPALVIAGTMDPVAPLRHARAVHEALEGSTFLEVDGAGHVPLAERRPEVAAAFRRFASTLGGLEGIETSGKRETTIVP
jgi:pimeloyl-ACP methyl ester carboxylesterase